MKKLQPIFNMHIFSFIRTTLSNCRFFPQFGSRLAIIITFAVLTSFFSADTKSQQLTETWQQTLTQAKNKPVNLYAWGGDEKINQYFLWLKNKLALEYSVDLNHVKLTDTAIAIQQIIAAKTNDPESDSNGRIDIVWINGENFKKLKEKNLLYGPILKKLPNYKYLDIKNNPNLLIDFLTPIEGYEVPFGKAQLVFIVDSNKVTNFPKNHIKLKEWIIDNPFRFTYPQLPNFVGSTFVKQILLMLNPNEDSFFAVPSESDYIRTTTKLWLYLDQIQDSLWQGGKNYVRNHISLIRLLFDNQVDIAMSFNPNEAATSIIKGDLSPNVKTHVFDTGTIGNTHYLAIPYNAKNKDAAMVVINYLISPFAQNRKADINIWGDPPVISKNYLTKSKVHKGQLDPTQSLKSLREIHPAWLERIEKDWQARYLKN